MLIASACSEQVHRNFISPPSLWPGRELRAYHCPGCASWRNAGATRILLLMVLTADQTDRKQRNGAAFWWHSCHGQLQSTYKVPPIFQLWIFIIITRFSMRIYNVNTHCKVKWAWKKDKVKGQFLIRMFFMRLSESADWEYKQNTQNSFLNSACFVFGLF